MTRLPIHWMPGLSGMSWPQCKSVTYLLHERGKLYVNVHIRSGGVVLRHSNGSTQREMRLEMDRIYVRVQGLLAKIQTGNVFNNE